jgi:hypothetical protein
MGNSSGQRRQFALAMLFLPIIGLVHGLLLALTALGRYWKA